uniref:Uncharacterized protein n=1 Tax=Lotus japonicus TaxID=34305 RepID=I3S0M0_LOTJA|nr:unknown [Lotus japonicus]
MLKSESCIRLFLFSSTVCVFLLWMSPMFHQVLILYHT